MNSESFRKSVAGQRSGWSLFWLRLLGQPEIVRTAEVLFGLWVLRVAVGFSALELLVLLSVVTALLPVGLILLLVLRHLLG
mgnify:FL=1